MEEQVPAWAARVVAANLTSAAHMYMLSMQLRGETISLTDALSFVRATWERLASDLGDDEAWAAAITSVHNVAAVPQIETMVAAATDTAPVTVSSMPKHTDTEELPPLDATEVKTEMERDTAPVAETKPEAKHDTAPVEDPALLEGHYSVRGSLGKGRMGDVLLAEEVQTKQLAAIKFLKSEKGDPERALRFFRQEAEALRKLNHPNIARINEVTVSEGRILIAMDYVAGETLQSVLARSGPPPVEEAIRISREIASTVGAAHLAGLVHRNLRPENVMLVFREAAPPRPVILDFGLAIDDGDVLLSITGSGAYSGSHAYMPPEQTNALPLTPASDVYSIGVIAYELLTGKNPFAAESAADTAMRHAAWTPTPPSRVRQGIPAKIDAAVMRALAKQPEERYPSAAELSRAL